MLGGGQLGRMFTVAARTMGYRVIVLDPDPQSPAGHIADKHIQADFHDTAALSMLSESCAAITTEFENVPADTLDILAKTCFVRPSAKAVAITQDRVNEKQFLLENKIPTNRFAAVSNEGELREAFKIIGPPAILKRSRLGYDGKGQWKTSTLDDALDAFHKMGAGACVLEEMLAFQSEVSVVLARGIDGQIAAYPVAENIHTHGILDISMVPARVSEKLSGEAKKISIKIAEKIDYVGIMAVEMFVMPDDRVLVNEIAPRPHNSGHYTLDACTTNQFEQQVRTLCGLPPGDTRLLSPVVMVNLLGDVWNGGEPGWENILREPNIKLHLYGKEGPRSGRKMGHFNCLDSSVEKALEKSLEVKKLLQPVN